MVTAGTGRVQRWGDRIEEIRMGDVVRIPADQEHWHGAAPQVSMAHIAITEPRAGTNVQWMEKVTDEQYPDTRQIAASAERTAAFDGASERRRASHANGAGQEPPRETV